MTYAPITAVIATPIGKIYLWGDEVALHGIRISSNEMEVGAESASGAVAQAADAVSRYFAGDVRTFDIPLAASKTLRGAQLRAGIASVPYGQTLTYGELARQISSGARAVGAACRTNPFPIIVPCHRIVSASAQMSYYSAGDGPSTKAWLLAHEQRHS